MTEQDEAGLAKLEALRGKKRAEIVQATSHFLDNELGHRREDAVIEGVFIALAAHYGLNTVTRSFRHHFGGDGR